MGKLIAEAEGDDEFWNQDAWKEARDSCRLALLLARPSRLTFLWHAHAHTLTGGG